MRSLLKEPLIHFLLIGAALFAVSTLAGRSDRSAETIVVTAGEIDALAEGFTRTWQRRPTPVELDALIQERVRDDVYGREAIAQGLDKNDEVIRRRLRQKLEFVTEDTARAPAPTEADLRGYLAAHPESFRVEPRLTFRHVFLDPARHEASLEPDARRLIERLDAAGPEADPARYGDAFVYAHTFDDVPEGVVARQFGPAFAAKLADLPLGRWQGPILSGYGAHVVLVTRRTDGKTPELEEIRDAVRREWEDARRLDASEAYYRSLLAKYRVRVERPATPAAAP
jgi:hypothetical protein